MPVPVPPARARLAAPVATVAWAHQALLTAPQARTVALLGRLDQASANHANLDISECGPGSSAQSPCPLGTFSNASNAQSDSACIHCQQGTYMDQTSATACTKCPAGKFSSASKAVSLSYCLSCPAGFYCVEGSTQATQCPAGTYSGLTEQTSNNSCQDCQAGYYCATGSSAQSACPVGTFSVELRISRLESCQLCPPATYNDATAATVCTNCSAGTYNSIYGASIVTDCKSCPVGKYCPEGSIQGIDCPVGKANFRTGRGTLGSCQLCATLTYADVPGLAYCKPCEVCSIVGQYRIACGGASAGICTSYNNTI